MTPSLPTPSEPEKGGLDPFRRAVLRGLGVLLPPLLTIVIFLWVGNTVTTYVFKPLEGAIGYWQVEWTGDIRTASELPAGSVEEGIYTQAEEGKTPKYVPTEVYDDVAKRMRGRSMPDTAVGVYRNYVDENWAMWLGRRVALIGVFILIVYSLGKFFAAGIGRFFWHRFEALIDRVPLVRNVYSSVKQVTDFVFTESEIEQNFSRVVAVEFPRKGMWCVAFVTGESMLDIESAANEPVMSVLIPNSPMPFTGFTLTVKKSEAVDLNITIEQAFQFFVSCGVVVPPQQITRAVAERAKQGRSGESFAGAVATPTLAARDAADDE
ncbi:MAG: DUF502 domain-containing protein [Planctomycetota bacterium]